MSAASERLKAVLATSPAHAEWEAVNIADLRELLAEITRLRSLVEEAKGVVERCQAVLAIMVKPDMTVSSLSAYTACFEAEMAARSLLLKLKGE